MRDSGGLFEGLIIRYGGLEGWIFAGVRAVEAAGVLAVNWPVNMDCFARPAYTRPTGGMPPGL